MPPRTLGAVIVTGGGGRIGRLVVADLRGRGVRVFSLSRRLPASPHADDVAVDLRDAAAVREVFVGVRADAIVHLAAMLSGEDLATQNLLIDSSVAAAARETEMRRVVHTSSCAVYGTNMSSALDENAALLGDGAYARSKSAGEDVFAALAAQDRRASVTTLRIFNIAGPDFPGSLVNRLIRATSEDPVAVVEPDRFIRDYIHQSDVVAVLRASIEREQPGHLVLNVGAGFPVATRMLLDALDVHEPRVAITRGPASTNWADVTRLTATLGVVPRPVPSTDWAQPTLPDPSPAVWSDGRIV